MRSIDYPRFLERRVAICPRVQIRYNLNHPPQNDYKCVQIQTKLLKEDVKLSELPIRTTSETDVLDNVIQGHTTK
jgi:hypothetical protein